MSSALSDQVDFEASQAGQPPFRSLVRTSANDPIHASSALADPYHQCRYPDIIGFLQILQTFLTSQGVQPCDCITVELNNSVRAALTALALLDAGYSMITMPVSGQGARGGGNEVPSPRFSKWIIGVRTEKGAAKAPLTDPEQYLFVQANPAFQPSNARPLASAPNLFFRTSGSLGDPKLAMHSHARFRRNVLNARSQVRLRSDYRIALPTPIFHLYGLGVGFLAGFASGASIDFQERGNLLRFLEREEDFNPNVAFVTPSFCEALLMGRKTPRRYELMITSGDKISDSVFHRSEKMHGPMINSYGSTEMGSVSTGNLEMSSEIRCRSVGVPYPGVSYRIAPIAVNPTDDANVGELQLKYDYGFEGYVDLSGNPLTPPSSFDDGWYRTGDLAALGEHGTLEVLGRCDLSINRNGVLLPFADVENRLREIDGVSETAVAAGADGIRGRALVAFVVLARGEEASGGELRARYAERAPAYAVLDAVHIVETLPKLASGKIDRRALARLAEQQSSVQD